MKRIQGEIVSFDDKGSLKRMSTIDLAASAGHYVASFEALVQAPAVISFANSRHSLLFRGQSSEPSLFRRTAIGSPIVAGNSATSNLRSRRSGSGKGA